MMEVRCGNCGWRGVETELDAGYEMLPDRGVTQIPVCPACRRGNRIEYETVTLEESILHLNDTRLRMLTAMIRLGRNMSRYNNEQSDNR